MAGRGERKDGPLCTTMTSVQLKPIKPHGTPNLTVQSPVGPTVASLAPIKGVPAGIDSPMGTVPNVKRSKGY